MHEQKKTDQQNHKACTRSSPQLMVENPGKWREGPRQIAPGLYKMVLLY